MERKYSLSEIDEMRKNLRTIRTWEFAQMLHDGSMISRWPADKQIETELRTLMMNGTDPSEIRNKAQQVDHDNYERMRAASEIDDATPQ